MQDKGFAGLFSFAKSWPMSFQSLHFLFFLPIVVCGYFSVPQRFRRFFLLLASYWFYFFTAPNYLLVLFFGTGLCYVCGRFIGAAKLEKPRQQRLVFSVLLLLGFLCFFKYNAFFAPSLGQVFASFGLEYPKNYFITGQAMGISFYVFTALAYCIDIARKDISPEKNMLNHALFMGFFPSVSMGPISRCGQLLPQLKNNACHFNPNTAAGALRLLGIGFFKKLAVSNTLGVFTKQIYTEFALDVSAYSGFTLTLAAAAFAAELYFDFSGYTDIARASAKLLGINLPQNFKNPYFSTNFSAFWASWHISLSSFLQDYVFMPLVWSRWTEKLPIIGKKVQNPPVLSAIAITFMLSGFWHGDTFPFVIWGALMGGFRIGEEVLHRIWGKPKKNLSPFLRLCKNAVVLVLWAESLVFFKMGLTKNGSASAAFAAICRQFLPSSFATVWGNVFATIKSGFYADSRVAMAFFVFCVLCTATAIYAEWLQHSRLKGACLSTAMATLPTARRWAVYIGLIICCFAGFIAQSGGFSGGSFLYGGF